MKVDERKVVFLKIGQPIICVALRPCYDANQNLTKLIVSKLESKNE